MSHPTPENPIHEPLLEHSGYLRRLARGLLFDPGRADDVVQRTWLEAVRAGRGAGAPRSWLAGVVRNLARNSQREERRRGERERAAARPEAQPSAGETVERLETLRRVVDAVQALEEPYRSTLLLRFFDDLPPRAIARRQNVPVATVRTRVQRGLAQLRRRLDLGAGSGGDGGRALLGALLPLAGPIPWTLALPVSAGTALEWSATVGTSIKIPLVAAGAAAVLVGVSLYTFQDRGAGDSPGPAGAITLDGGETGVGVHGGAAPQDTAVARPPTAPVAVPTGIAGEAREPVAAPGAWVARGVAQLGRTAPFAGAAVRAQLYTGYERGPEPTLVARLTCDADGVFAWALEPPEGAVLLVLALEVDGHLKFEDERLVPPGEAPPQDLRVRAYPLDCAVVGVVRDRGGRPIEDATIAGFGQSARSDAEGRYRLPAASGISRLYVYAHADGCAQRGDSLSPEGPGVDLALDFELEPAFVLAGRVVDEGGRSVEGARVGAFGLTGAKVETGPDGRFAFEHLPRFASVHRVWASKAGFAMTRAELEPGSADSGELELRLARGARVEGRVVDAETGAPVAGANLTVGFSPYDFEGVHAVSRDAGEFTLEGVAHGRCELWVRRAGRALSHTFFEVPEGVGLVAGIDVALERGHFIGGVVVDASGRPRAEVSVSARLDDEYLEGTERTDAEGRFRLVDLPSPPRQGGAQAGAQGTAIDGRSLSLELWGTGFVRSEHPVRELDREDLRLVVEASGGFAGRVVDGATGAPLRTFRVRFVDPVPQAEPGEERLTGYTSDWVEGRNFTRDGGRWDTAGEELAPGSIVGVEVSAPGYAAALVGRAVVTEHGGDELVHALWAGASVAGRVVSRATGAPIEGVLVMRFTEDQPLRPWAFDDSEGRLSARTDATGRFELAPVPEGAMSLAISHPDFARTEDGPFAVPRASAPAARWIELAEGACITGRALTLDGAPRAGSPVSLNGPGSGPDAGRDETTTDADGRFAFEHLRDGTYQIALGIERGTRTVYDVSRSVEVRDGASVAADLRPTGSASIEGTLRFAGELPDHVVLFARPAPEHPLLERDGSGAGTRGAFAEQGRFRIEGLEPGPWIVVVSHGDHRGQSLTGNARVELTEGATSDTVIDVERQER